ncbi:MAG: hypothetical protein HKN00_09605 [Flavobacteriaceae bacterium]|nr:hypothetical protein [Bacteroidia bacterium]NNF75428.1 hypothetical protein [Flavobacteriaceae bacterium]
MIFNKNTIKKPLCTLNQIPVRIITLMVKWPDPKTKAWVGDPIGIITLQPVESDYDLNQSRLDAVFEIYKLKNTEPIKTIPIITGYLFDFKMME